MMVKNTWKAPLYPADYEEHSEPVAWMSPFGNNFVSKKAPSYTKIGTDNWIPLYTTPHHASDVKQTKPLSDEEIFEIKTLMEINYGCVPPLEFAWAIEAKVRGQ